MLYPSRKPKTSPWILFQESDGKGGVSPPQWTDKIHVTPIKMGSDTIRAAINPPEHASIAVSLTLSKNFFQVKTKGTSHSLHES